MVVIFGNFLKRFSLIVFNICNDFLSVFLRYILMEIDNFIIWRIYCYVKMGLCILESGL